MNLWEKLRPKKSTSAVVQTAMLFGVLTAFFLTATGIGLVFLFKVVGTLLGDASNSVLLSLAEGVGALIGWDLPCVVTGYIAARVGRRVPILSIVFTAVFCLVIDVSVDLIEGGWASARDLLECVRPSAMVILGGLFALPVNAWSKRKFENVMAPMLMLAFELTIAAVLYAIGMWAALNTGPLAGLASIAAMMIAMAGTIAMTEPQRRNRLALILVAAGWAIPVSVVVFGVVIGFAVSSAAWLVFFQTLAVLCGYAWLFRLYPEQFRGDHAPIWARRFVRRLVIEVPTEESLA